MDALPVTEETDLPFKSTVRTEYLGQEVGVRLGAELTKAAFFDRDAKFVRHPPRAFVFPPIKAFENRGLCAFARIVLKDDELGVGQFPLHTQGGDDLLCRQW